jgi:hypothetical protein
MCTIPLNVYRAYIYSTLRVEFVRVSVSIALLIYLQSLLCLQQPAQVVLAHLAHLVRGEFGQGAQDALFDGFLHDKAHDADRADLTQTVHTVPRLFCG